MRNGRLPAAATLLALIACAGNSVRQAPLEVRVASVSDGSISVPLELSGNVVASQQSALSATVSGRLAQLNVRIGSRVRTGDVVATIDGATYRAQQQQTQGDVSRTQGEEDSARSSLAEAQARFDLARATESRMANLSESGDVSRQSYDQAHSEYVAAKAAVAKAQAAIAASAGAHAAAAGAFSLASSQLAETVVRAPFDGTIVQKLADPGTIVVPGTPIVQLQDDSALEIDVAVPQTSVAGVQRGQPLSVRLDGSAERSIMGRVASVTAMSDPALRSVLVKVVLPPVPQVVPGMYARIAFPGRQQSGAGVPLSALVTRAGQTGVFVISKGVATFAPVRVKLTDRSFALIDGLRPSDHLVVVGDTSRLSDGSAVSVSR